MAASHARELQSVSLLSATHAEHPAIGRAAAVLLALGWAVLLSCAGLEAAVCEWSTGPLLQQLSGYSWQHSSVDAAFVALLALLVSSIAVCSYPLVGALVSSILGVLAVVKLVYLANMAAGAQAVAVAATAAVSCWSATAACGVALQRSHGARSTPRINDGRAEKLLGGGDSSSANPKEVTLGRLLGVARPELPMLGVATIALFLSSAAQMAMPALVGNMVGGVIGGSDDSGDHSSKLRSLNGAVLELAIIFVVGGFFAFVRGTLFTMAGERVVARLRRRLFATLVQQDIGFFDSNKTGELMNRLSSDTMVIQNAVTINVSMGLRFGAQVVIGLVLIFFESWKLSMMMLSIVPAIVLVAIAYGRFMKRFSKKYQEALAKASDVAQETFSGMRTVRSFAMEGREAERYTLSIDRSYKLGKSKAFAYGVFGSLIGTVGQFAVVGVLWYGGALVLKGEMSLGTLTSFLLYTLTIAACLGGLSDLFGSLMNALGASQRVFALLDSRPTRPLVGGERLDGFLGRIQLHEVSFSYPTRPESLVLDRISLTIEPGSVVALCGSSGSGKSTVIGLIERWYEPTSGSITIDSVPLSLLDGSWWRKQVALVAQEPVLFACSIWENVAYGCLGADEAAVRAAARTANAEAFIDSFDHGFDTLVGERGVQLSGGQKQRIAIARALLVDPKVLLLDEATSALDAESEHVVQEAIDRLMSQRTTIVVAHRLSTIRSADTICVVSKGQIVEQGTHDELVDRAGIYKQLTARQAFNLSERAS